MNRIASPFLVAPNLMRRCNLACAHSYLNAGILGGGDEGGLSTSEAEAPIDDSADLNDETMVVRTGGEPMLRRDLAEVTAGVIGALAREKFKGRGGGHRANMKAGTLLSEPERREGKP